MITLRILPWGKFQTCKQLSFVNKATVGFLHFLLTGSGPCMWNGGKDWRTLKVGCRTGMGWEGGERWGRRCGTFHHGLRARRPGYSCRFSHSAITAFALCGKAQSVILSSVVRSESEEQVSCNDEDLHICWTWLANSIPSYSSAQDLSLSSFSPVSDKVGISAFRVSGTVHCDQGQNASLALNQPSIQLQSGRAAGLISWHKHTEQARQAPRSYLKPNLGESFSNLKLLPKYKWQSLFNIKSNQW